MLQSTNPPIGYVLMDSAPVAQALLATGLRLRATRVDTTPGPDATPCRSLNSCRDRTVEAGSMIHVLRASRLPNSVGPSPGQSGAVVHPPYLSCQRLGLPFRPKFAIRKTHVPPGP